MLKRILAITATVGLLAACVPARRFHEAERSIRFYQDKSDECNVEADILKKRVKQLESDIAQLQKDKLVLEQDTTLYGMRNRTLLNQLATLENDLKALAAKNGDSPEYKALMKHLLQMQDNLVDSEDKRLGTERAIELQKKALAEAEEALAESEENLARSEREIQNKNSEIAQQNAALANARSEIEDQAARLRELEAALAAKDNAMAELKNSIANALTDFTSDELTVTHKNGRVYVSLEEQLLFESGKYDVNSKGVSALKKIASVLASRNELDIVVEGHTDNVPYHGQIILDNWDLSVKRATSVLRILIANGSIDQAHIEATGRADSCPIDTNSTPEGRRKNRRTEVILAPNMDQIIGILGK
ncbi:MAG: OmpA family protein [Bacteroidales bacterium]|nr:OmpA family protein [Bacteroidales bacterium]